MTIKLLFHGINGCSSLYSYNNCENKHTHEDIGAEPIDIDYLVNRCNSPCNFCE